MLGHLDMSIKRDRSRRLIEVSNQLEKEYNELFLNKEVEVLIEEVVDNKSIGHTSNYLKVEVDEVLTKNTLVNVKIIKIDVDKVKAIVK